MPESKYASASDPQSVRIPVSVPVPIYVACSCACVCALHVSVPESNSRSVLDKLDHISTSRKIAILQCNIYGWLGFNVNVYAIARIAIEQKRVIYQKIALWCRREQCANMFACLCSLCCVWCACWSQIQVRKRWRTEQEHMYDLWLLNLRKW